jgi:hypothetical protein
MSTKTWEINKKGTPWIEKESRTPNYISDTLSMVINNRDQYKDYVVGDFIYGVLYDSISKIQVVEKIKDFPQMISIIVKETLTYIYERIKSDWDGTAFCFEAIEIFHICCLLDLSQTNQYFENTLSNMKYKIIQVYSDILASYIVKEKYKLLKTHLKFMPNGEGYLESKEHFESISIQSENK